MNNDITNEQRSKEDAMKGDTVRKEVHLPTDLHDDIMFVATAQGLDFNKYARQVFERDLYGRKEAIIRRVRNVAIN